MVGTDMLSPREEIAIRFISNLRLEVSHPDQDWQVSSYLDIKLVSNMVGIDDVPRLLFH